MKNDGEGNRKFPYLQIPKLNEHNNEYTYGNEYNYPENKLSNSVDTTYRDPETKTYQHLLPPSFILGVPDVMRTPTSIRRSMRSSRFEGSSIEYTSFSQILRDFCARTSSHGIPFVGSSSFFGRYVWLLFFVVASLLFAFQTYWTLSEYFQYRTIIEMQLKFEPAPFPAATICNLNAFKASKLRQFEEIEQGFAIWEKAMNQIDSMKNNLQSIQVRKKRHVLYNPVYVRCVCNTPEDQCVPQRNPLDVNTTVCLCYEEANTGDIWPCYPTAVWAQKTCYHCSSSQTCDDPDRPPNITTLLTDAEEAQCMCQSISHHCIKKTKSEIAWWNPNNYTIYPITTTTTPPEVEEAFGLSDLKDRGAITTKTKENLIFLVAAMPLEVRKELSYTLDEFVLRCSFNSEDCVMDRDFQLHMDPEYGNCYTFNFNDSVELKNSRAGPMYGLRLLLNVAQKDYMPTTEAAGVRLVVHEQDQEPFPDTFGYSAPTGFVSSFGLKTKVLQRLDSPYGLCSDTFRPEGYIYAEHYSPEGCYRNCFQHKILQHCGCGDPRFPLGNETLKPCDARNYKQRSCLTNFTNSIGGFHHLQEECHCVQPCTEYAFETAYSAAAWPAINFNIGADCPAVLDITNDSKACAEYYRLNTAYIEIYYEQLNFETLKETAGYTLVNLFSDFGGNIGLWIGFSVITVLEVVELLCEIFYYAAYKKPTRFIKNKRRKDLHNKIQETNILPTPRILSVEERQVDRDFPVYRRRTACIKGGNGVTVENIVSADKKDSSSDGSLKDQYSVINKPKVRNDMGKFNSIGSIKEESLSKMTGDKSDSYKSLKTDTSSLSSS
uniref:Degenerin unc-8 n=1 Tax=Strongyloides papillosus TaxID=174720 RepID=A0A0N5B7F1_STREA